MQHPRTYKLVIIGDQNVGKTSLCHRYLYGYFDMYIQPTIGVSFNRYNYNGTDQVVSIWDISGSERYYNITPLYFHSANAFILVVSVECYNRDNILRWIRRTQEILPYQPPFYIFVNKVDLIDLTDIDIDEEISNIVKEYHLNGWYKVSAYTGVGVNEAFDQVISSMIERYPEITPPYSLSVSSPPTSKRGCCLRPNVHHR
jgi:small GTP-binding protein